jgi:hypothetical protein
MRTKPTTSLDPRSPNCSSAALRQLSKQDSDELFERVVSSGFPFPQRAGWQEETSMTGLVAPGLCIQITFDRVGSSDNTNLSKGRAIIILKVNV